MSAPNLTREQAIERAEVVSVENYRIELDLTGGTGESGPEAVAERNHAGPSHGPDGRSAGKPGEQTFLSRSTVTFGAKPGASTFVDIVARRVRSAVLNGTPLEIGGYDESIGLTLTDRFTMQPFKSVSGVMVAGLRPIHRFPPTFPFCRNCAAYQCRDRLQLLAQRRRIPDTL